MRRLLVLVLVLLAPLAAARTVTIEATPEGFVVEGVGGLNPTLSVAPGEDLVFRFTNRDDAAQDLALGDPPVARIECCVQPGFGGTLRYRVPADADGDIPYLSTVEPEKFRGILRAGALDPTVTLEAPADQATVGGRVEVSFSVRDFTLEPHPSGKANARGWGHARVLLDGKDVTGPTANTTLVLDELALGFHLIRVELLARDGTSLGVADEAVVYRAPDRPEPTPATGPPAARDRDTPAPGALAVLATLALAARRRFNA